MLALQNQLMYVLYFLVFLCKICALNQTNKLSLPPTALIFP